MYTLVRVNDEAKYRAGVDSRTGKMPMQSTVGSWRDETQGTYANLLCRSLLPI
jgi:hypothetical protein